MSPWRLIFDALGWLLIGVLVFAALEIVVSATMDYARDLWDARGEPPEKMDYTSTMDEDRRRPR